MSWEFWVDRGGTFTDCIGRDESDSEGRLHTAKVLSGDDAPVEGIRQILERVAAIEPGAALPPCRVKLGSTVATNALLERRGVRTLLLTNRGLGDVLTIGTQQRPDLFDLAIDKPPPLHERALEVAGRRDSKGECVEPLDEASTRRALQEARGDGIRSVAVVGLHAHAEPEDELRLAAWAREAGFDFVTKSHEVAREIGLLARGETTVADAYLTPLLRSHVAGLAEALPNSQLRFMQSSGGVTDASRFRGPTALLSGPAGGVVAAARVATRAGHADAISFDMGGTSTDVSLIVDGEVERSFESLVGGIRVKAPMLRIHTVAAGGGSLCAFDGIGLTVGPESAGADPGPLCYGRPRPAEDSAAAEPAAGLALTDVNAFLGRVQPDRFPFPLDSAPVEAALAACQAQLREAGIAMELDAVAAGFVEVANAGMADAIQQVSVARGVDPRDHVLVGFGGAGGQHVCAIARSLGIRRVLLHPLAGLLSAYGIGAAELSWDRQRDTDGALLEPSGRGLPAAIAAIHGDLERLGRDALLEEGGRHIQIERWADLRYRGTDASLAIREPRDESISWREEFEREHRDRFGYVRPGRDVEVVTARLRAHAEGGGAAGEGGEASPLRSKRPVEPAIPAPTPQALRHERVFFPGMGRREAPVYAREDLLPGAELIGPAVLLEGTGTVVLEPGFRARVDPDRVLVIDDELGARVPRPEKDDFERFDPVRLEVFGNRFMSIAEQMGAVLRNTAISTNIKERLDYSCAVFDAEAGLVANAPHIPVHLGAMGETVRAVRRRFPSLAPGDVVATNDPYEGGSHLPDVTVVTPVFLAGEAGEAPAFFVASRGHHADLGGRTPGSMPPDSHDLEEEGVLIEPFRIVQGGRFDEATLRRVLGAARYPARNPDDNVADLEAMVAANHAGERLLREWVAQHGQRQVAVTMSQLQRAAGQQVAHQIGRLPDGVREFADALDDGTPIRVRLAIEGDHMDIDFAGTGPVSSGNLNAPPAVVTAAVLYVLRSMVDSAIPLNGGCLAPVTLRIPEGSILHPPRGAAVVGGNVETSQRVVDVLLGALGLAAASQGTMNNVTFGDESFGYYETIGGGAGAGPGFAGASGVHTHMTNTRITDPEVLESRFPVRLLEFSLRRGSGGAGRRPGGDGLVRRYEFLAPVTVSLLTERRSRAPFGLAGGSDASPGRNSVLRVDGRFEELAAKCSVSLSVGDQLEVRTPGGGGYGAKGSN